MKPELRDLKWAIVASRHRSLRQAAETLNTRQSTLSRRLRDLEVGIGVDLFERTTGGTKPTPVGREFLEAAQRIVDEADRVFLRFKTRRDVGNRPLRIGICSSLSGLLGHSGRGVTQRYIHLDRALVMATDKVAEEIERALDAGAREKRVHASAYCLSA